MNLRNLSIDELARERAHCGASPTAVLKVFAANVDRLRGVLFDAVAALPENATRDCPCTKALGGMDPGFELP